MKYNLDPFPLSSRNFCYTASRPAAIRSTVRVPHNALVFMLLGHFLSVLAAQPAEAHHLQARTSYAPDQGELEAAYWVDVLASWPSSSKWSRSIPSG